MNSYYKLKNELNEELVNNELRVAIEAASHYSRNYYAWSHRTWIFTVYLINSSYDFILEVCFKAYCFNLILLILSLI